ncbi:uncharacterized protein LOC123701725 [Colias croceus]|uniref:uncharacterized protein LOC123701725 n=1 Tax=Colias crocea TaxID=72248 RepID=UPI001E27DF49|nr:uncharacterized protein LOC123701725 [Colias croceus]
MEECGVVEPLNNWFRDYLTSRSFKVRIEDTFSDGKAVLCGVPQGSGCGPVCYLMHVNSLCGVLKHCTAHMFADDLCAMRAGTDLAETCRLVQTDIDAVVKWSHDNGIVLNTDKTKLLIVHSPYLPLSQTYSMFTHTFECIHNQFKTCICKPIERVKTVTYLGMRVDEHFSWTTHIDYIYDKLKVLLGKFYHLSYKVPIKTLKCLYMALVDSILSYSLDCYGLTTKTNLNKLENMQIRFLKLLVSKKIKDKYKHNYRMLFKFCNILPVSLKHKYLLAVNNHSSISSLILLNTNHTTRSVTSGKYEVPRVNNYFGDRTLDKRLPYFLNSLPEYIRTEANIHKFKSLLRKHLLQSLEC